MPHCGVVLQDLHCFIFQHTNTLRIDQPNCILNKLFYLIKRCKDKYYKHKLPIRLPGDFNLI